MNNHLEHHGVKGMKWGVRRRRKNPKQSSEVEKSSVKKKRVDKKKLARNIVLASSAIAISGIATTTYVSGRKRTNNMLQAQKIAKMSTAELFLHMNQKSTPPKFTDKVRYGSSGANRIAKGTSKGKSRKKLQNEELRRQMGRVGLNLAIDKLKGSLKMSDDTNHLEHHGVKGMKWGVRRRRKNPTKPKPRSAEAKRYESIKSQAKSKGVRSLSNEQLRFANDRANLERQYSSLHTEKASATRQFGERLVKNVGKDIAISVATAGAAALAAKYGGNTSVVANIIEKNIKKSF